MREQLKNTRRAVIGRGFLSVTVVADPDIVPELYPLTHPLKARIRGQAASARSRRLSSILRIIQTSPNSTSAEKAMEGESHR